MIFLLLNCTNMSLQENAKTKKKERIQLSSLITFSSLAYKEDEAGLMQIEKAILEENEYKIDYHLFHMYYKHEKRISSLVVRRNSVQIYKILQKCNKKFLSFCLQVAKEESNLEALEKILEVMEATELEREILLGTKENVELMINGDLKKGNEAIIAVSSDEIFKEVVKSRASGKLLLECVMLGLEDRVEQLLKVVVNLEERTVHEFTLLMCAVANNRVRLVEILLTKARVDINEVTTEGTTALMLASLNGYEEVLDLLLKHNPKVNQTNIYGTSALMFAANEGYQGVVRRLLAAGARVDEEREDGSTPLLFSVMQGHEGVIDILLPLVEQEKINELYIHEQTLLMFAAQNGHKGVVRRLLAAGAEVSIATDSGTTVAMLAAENGDTELLDLLAEAGADFSVVDNSQMNLLMQASYSGKENMVRKLLRLGLDKEAKDKDGKSALIYAIQNRHTRVIELLLAANVEIETRDKDGLTAVMLASLLHYPEAVELLIKAGAKLNKRNKFGAGALELPLTGEYSDSIEKVLKLLLSNGAPFDYRIKWLDGYLDNTLLMFAVRSDNFVMAHTLLELRPEMSRSCIGEMYESTFLDFLTFEKIIDLLELGLINISDVNDNGMTNFYYLCKKLENGSKKELELLEKRVQLAKQAYVGEHELLGTQEEREELRRLLTQHDRYLREVEAVRLERQKFPILNKYKRTFINVISKYNPNGLVIDKADEKLLFDSLEKGDIDSLKRLREQGKNINVVNNLRKSPIQIISEAGDENLLEFYLSIGIEPEIRVSGSFTPLMLFILKKNIKVVKQLLEFDTVLMTLNYQNSVGKSALIYASEFGAKAILELLAAGANKELKDEDGQTALLIAALNGHDELVAKLLEAEADKEVTDASGQTLLMKAAQAPSPETLERVLSLGVELERRDFNGNTALALAAEKGRARTIERLLELGADKEARNKRYQTPILLASMNTRAEAVITLLKAGADKEAKDKNGKTPLLLAIRSVFPDTRDQYIKLIKILIEAGADKEAKDNNDQTSIMLAARHGDMELIKILIEAGADKEARDKNGETLLVVAARNRDIELIRVLLAAGANIEVRDKNNQTPIMLAAERGDIELIRVLIGAEVRE